MTRDSMESSGTAGRERSASSDGRNAGAGHNSGAGGGPQRPSFGRDALGLVLLLLACFFGVAAAMAYIDPREQASGMTGLVMALVEFLGISCFFLAAGLGWIGFRLWIRGVDGKVGRDLFGVAITTLTLAVLVGSLSPELGGTVGRLGAVVTSQLTVFVGLIFGVMVVLLPAWFLWLRPAALAAGEVPRTSAPLSPRASDSSGVSQAEAEGLFPKVAPRPPAPRAPAPAEPRASRAAQPAAEAADPFADKSARAPSGADSPKFTPPKVVAPSPYPPDVRREGRVPEGARPLGGGSVPAAPASASAPAAAVKRAPEPAPQAVHEHHPDEHPRHAQALRVEPGAAAAGAGLVADELRRAVPPPVADDGRAQRGPALEPVAGPAGAPARGDAARDALNPALADERASEETFADELAQASRVAEPSLTQPLERTPPKPSWEQSDLFEEPVDAYGTPLSLVEKLRAGEGAALEQDAPRADRAARTAAADDQPLPWGADEELGDEVLEDSIRPLEAKPAPADAPTVAAVAEDDAAAALASEVAVEIEPEVRPEAAPDEPAAASVSQALGADASTSAAEGATPRETSEELRQQLRGFIDLRERSSAARAEPSGPVADESSAREPRWVEPATVAASALAVNAAAIAARAEAEPAAPTADEVAPAAALEAAPVPPSESSHEAQLEQQVEAQIEEQVEPNVEAHAQPAVEETITSPESLAAASGELAGEATEADSVAFAAHLDTSAEFEREEQSAPTAEADAELDARTPLSTERSGAASRPQVVIRSLFEEPPTPVNAAAGQSSAPAVDDVAAPEPVAPASPAAQAAQAPLEESAPLAMSDVVLEPARRAKRKPKAPRTGGEPTKHAVESAADELAPSHETAREPQFAAAGEHGANAALAAVEQVERTVAVEPVERNEPSEAPAAPAFDSRSASAAASAREASVDVSMEASVEAPVESHVELAPARPRARSRVTVDEVVFKAGCLFVERQRVAVSMLQREFGLDFDAATAVLDQLQRVGLIGPYLGGQRRDILLSMDEWQELVGVE